MEVQKSLRFHKNICIWVWKFNEYLAGLNEFTFTFMGELCLINTVS